MQGAVLQSHTPFQQQHLHRLRLSLTSSPSTGAPRLFIATLIWCVRPVSGFKRNARSAGPRCSRCPCSTSACCAPCCCSSPSGCCPPCGSSLCSAACCDSAHCCRCCCCSTAACASPAAPSQAHEVKRVTAGKAELRVSSQLPRRPFCGTSGIWGGKYGPGAIESEIRAGPWCKVAEICMQADHMNVVTVNDHSRVCIDAPNGSQLWAGSHAAEIWLTLTSMPPATVPIFLEGLRSDSAM